MTLKTIGYSILILLCSIVILLLGILLFSTAFDFLLSILCSLIAYFIGYRRSLKQQFNQ